MSIEKRDTTYKLTKKSETTDQPSTRQSGRRITRRVDYKEVELLSSSGESEETIVQSESGFSGSVKLKLGEQELESELRDNLWTPGTIRSNAVQVTDQLNRLAEVNSEIAMSRESERSGVEKLMEIIFQMQTQERERVVLREHEKIERNKKE